MLLYLTKLTLCWGIFALFYGIFLRRETFFTQNRLFLLGGLILGLVMPFTFPSLPLADSSNAASNVITLPTIAVGLGKIEAINQTPHANFWLWIWAAGCFFLGFRLLFGIASLMRIIHSGQRESLENGLICVVTEKASKPFSFFKWICIHPKTAADPQTAVHIIAHESAHAHGLHSADVVFLEMLAAIFWFHPLVYWYKSTIRTLHEYSADAAAASQSTKKQYGLLLIQQAQSGPVFALGNHFLQSQLKSRIIMLTKKNSHPIKNWKFALALPFLFLLTAVLRQAPLLAQQADPAHVAWVKNLAANNWIATDTIVTFNPQTYEESIKVVKNDMSPYSNKSGELTYVVTETIPEFPGGQVAMSNFLTQNLRYPEKAIANHYEANLRIRFIVGKTGKVGEVALENFEGKVQLEEFVNEAIRVVASMPNWKPATMNGQPVNAEMSLPINFKL